MGEVSCKHAPPLTTCAFPCGRGSGSAHNNKPNYTHAMSVPQPAPNSAYPYLPFLLIEHNNSVSRITRLWPCRREFRDNVGSPEDRSKSPAVTAGKCFNWRTKRDQRCHPHLRPSS